MTTDARKDPGAATRLPPIVPLTLRQQWLLVNRPRFFVDQLRDRHGDVVNAQIRGQPWLIVLSAEGARQVFSADPLGYDAFFKESLTGLAGRGSLWVLGGETHRRHRKVFSTPFHARHVGAYGEAIRSIVRRHLEDWQPGQTRKALDTTLSIALDVVLRVVFWADGDQVLHEGRAAVGQVTHSIHPVIVFVPRLQRRWFPPWARFARAQDGCRDWINRRVAARRARGGQSDDVLGLMLAAGGEDSSILTDLELRDELLTILVSGHETTATALAWALYELSLHQAVLVKLRAELETVGIEADPDVIATLPYLSAVCNETLRLHTILAETSRMCVQPMECLGYVIPPGHGLSVSMMAVHHDARLYAEPDVFIPERFIERTFSASEFLPFGGGDRRCLGASLSNYQMRIALAEIVMSWEFESAAVEREIRHGISMGTRYGVPLRITARRQIADQADRSVASLGRKHA